MTEDKTPPTPLQGGSKDTEEVSQQLTSLAPPVVQIVTRLGQIFEVGQPYPQISEGYRAVAAQVVEIWEVSSEDDTGRSFRVRCRPEDPRYEGNSLIETVPGSAVAQLGRSMDAETLAGLEKIEETAPDCNPQGWRVTASFGGGLAALVYELGRLSPELPPPHTGLRGKVVGISRTEEDSIRVAIEVPENPLIPKGSIFALEVRAYFGALELLDDKRADLERDQALTDAINALEEAAEGDDDSEEGDDDAEGDDADDSEEGALCRA